MNEIIPASVIIEDANSAEYYEEPNTDEIDELLSDIEFVDWDDDKLVKHTASADVPISNFLPVPVEDIIYDDGGERSRFFRVKGLQSENGVQRELPTVKVDANDIANLNWVTSEWGFDALIYPPTMSRKDTLRSVMFMIGQKSARKKTIYTHTGWREENGRWFYLHAGGAIGNDDAEVDIDSRLRYYNLSGEKRNFISVSTPVIKTAS